MWVEMIVQHADAERSIAPGERAQFPNDTAEKLIRDGAARAVDGPRDGIRTRPVDEPARPVRPRKTVPKKTTGETGETGGANPQQSPTPEKKPE
ncbi:hypothetical protein [Herbidospora mongoliensis]|uniref:hypothetical protein n=1 Tax=Herbidospora mongoliensis TaxID=688067 RepID=UPI000831779E|nr:hypothetical protein [Herbidospora mongoliensis]